MAQFKGTVEGNRGEASRLGSKANGMVTTCNGWNMGVTVVATHDDGVDTFEIWQTGGSNRGNRDKLLTTITEEQQ